MPYSPPPPPIEVLPDTAHGQAIRGNQKRLSKVEECGRDTLAMARDTKRTLDIGVRIIALLTVSVLGGAGTLVVTSIQTTDRVERIQADMHEARDDRGEVHDDVDDIREGLVGLKASVVASERTATMQAQRTQKRLDDLTAAVNQRRRR